MKYVKITNCNDHNLWYSNCIGQIYGVLEVDRHQLKVRAIDGYLNYIDVNHCEEVNFETNNETT